MLQKLYNLGIHDGLSPETIKHVRILNQFNLFALFVAIISSSYALFFTLGTFFIAFGIISICLLMLPIFMNYKGHYVTSRVVYIVLNDCLLFSLPIIYGTEPHFQYYLLTAIGLPLIFLKDEIGNYKWLLALIVIPMFIYIEWHCSVFHPIVQFDANATYWVALHNDLSVMVTLMIMFSVFIKENQKHLREIENQKRKLDVVYTSLIHTEKDLKLALNEALKYQLKLLASQLNPNFIYTLMNSLQHTILHNDFEKALDFSSDFSNLTREMHTNSSKLYIRIKEEVEFIELFLKMQKKRINFEYLIKVNDLVESAHLMPPMILQPFVENAIVHGFSQNLKGGKLIIEINKIDDRIICTIQDNGIGQKAAIDTSKTRNDNVLRRSKGIAENRLDLYAKIERQEFHLEVMDLNAIDSTRTGTLVKISFPAFLSEDLAQIE